MKDANINTILAIALLSLVTWNVYTTHVTALKMAQVETKVQLILQWSNNNVAIPLSPVQPAPWDTYR